MPESGAKGKQRYVIEWKWFRFHGPWVMLAQMRTDCRNIDNSQTDFDTFWLNGHQCVRPLMCESMLTAYRLAIRQILSVSNCRSRAKRGTRNVEHQEDHMAFPGVRARRPAIVGEYGQRVIHFAFQKHHLGCEAGSEEPLIGTTTTL
jgi:hypothetical protein